MLLWVDDVVQAVRREKEGGQTQSFKPADMEG